MKRLYHILEFITNFSGYFSGWLVPLMIILIFAEVFMRYVMNQPLMVADEFSAYLLVALSFLGIAYTWKEKGHVRITALTSRVPARVAGWMRLITLALAFILSIGLTNSSYSYLLFSFKMHLKSPTIFRVPLQGPQMTILIGFILLDLILAAEIIRAIVNSRHPTEGEGTGEKAI